MLPVINSLTYNTELISDGRQIEFRPFLAKEQKILLMALETHNSDDVNKAVMDILSACILTNGVDVASLPSFDIQKIFLELRKRSIGEVIDVSINHPKGSTCEHSQKIQINLDDVKSVKHDDHSKKIKITEDIGVIMRYPSPAMSQKYKGETIENTFAMIAACIESIYDADTVYSTFTDEEITKWLGNLNTTQFQLITAFFHHMPSLEYEIDYKCDACGEQVNYKLETLADFFT